MSIQQLLMMSIANQTPEAFNNYRYIRFYIPYTSSGYVSLSEIELGYDYSPLQTLANTGY
jgi:hypothetical protein